MLDCDEMGNEILSFHSKSQTLAYIKNGEVVRNKDNAQFAELQIQRLTGVEKVVELAKEYCIEKYSKIVYPIKISGEWAGQGIQKGVGIAFLPHKSFFIFGMKIGEVWEHQSSIDNLHANDEHIYSITQFPVTKITIDFNQPEYAQNIMVERVNEVEEHCPVTKQLGYTTECTIGEGLVWVPLSESYCHTSGHFFKTKGEKHSVSKVKKVVSISTEKLESISDFVEYAVTENRLEQGIQELGLDFSLIGKYIGWISRDIYSEEADTLSENGLTMKDVGKYITNKSRQYYLNKLKEV